MAYFQYRVLLHRVLHGLDFIFENFKGSEWSGPYFLLCDTVLEHLRLRWYYTFVLFHINRLLYGQYWYQRKRKILRREDF